MSTKTAKTRSAPDGWIGVDIGGTGIKAGLVDTAAGTLIGERIRVETPHPSTPEAVVAATAELISTLGSDHPVGIGFPAPFVDGVPMMAANIDRSWVGVDAREAFSAKIGRPCAILNDADAAGLAEIGFGAGRDQPGVTLLLTLGTGIGSALFLDGKLVPNTELGHIEVRGKAGERRAAASVRENKGLSWKQWAARLNEYIDTVDRVIWPDLVILGGGVSKHADKWLDHLAVRPPVVPAQHKNEAGCVGAALHAHATFATSGAA